MRRREFIILLCCALMATPIAALAQEQRKLGD
jgi:hypothetical protein